MYFQTPGRRLALAAAMSFSLNCSDGSPDPGQSDPGGGIGSATFGSAGLAGMGEMPGTGSVAGTGGTDGIVDGISGMGGIRDQAGIEGAGGPVSEDVGCTTDPGTGPWQMVPAGQVADVCGLDVSLLPAPGFGSIGSGYAIIRHGQLCYEAGDTEGISEIWSTTKTLGATVTGVASYMTRDAARNGPMTGQLSDEDPVSHWLASTAGFNIHQDALIANVLSMNAHSPSMAFGSKGYTYDTVGTTQINALSTVITNAITQPGLSLGLNTADFAKQHLFAPLGMTQSTWAAVSLGSSWQSNVREMSRLGLLLLNGGVWNGKRVLSAEWVYRMTHPAFEDANTGYGYLLWLNTRDSNSNPGTLGPGTALNDRCAPVAIHRDYPHAPSLSPDCNLGNCTQANDVGQWSAQGLGGQYISGHPALDMVLVNKNGSTYPGPKTLWDAVRPALLAHMPTFQGDDAAFCEAYAAGNYVAETPAAADCTP